MKITQSLSISIENILCLQPLQGAQTKYVFNYIISTHHSHVHGVRFYLRNFVYLKQQDVFWIEQLNFYTCSDSYPVFNVLPLLDNDDRNITTNKYFLNIYAGLASSRFYLEISIVFLSFSWYKPRNFQPKLSQDLARNRTTCFATLLWLPSKIRDYPGSGHRRHAG